MITEVGRSAIGAERSAVAMLDPERLRLRTVNPAGLPDGPGAPPGDMPLDVPSVMTAAILARRPVLVESPDSAAQALRGRGQRRSVPAAHRRAGLGRACRCWPRARRWARCGSRSPGRGRSPMRSGCSWRRWPGQCALALERASMFEREHTTAETLQRSLLPDRLPTVPGIILEASYLPVTRNMEIGGDWYDAFRLPDGKLAVAAGRRHGQGADRRGRDGPGPQRAARAGADRPAARPRCWPAWTGCSSPPSWKSR